MLKFVFITAFLFHATTSSLHQLQESWLDDVDGPKFLRGAEEEIQEDNEELDPINDFPNDVKRVAQDDIVTATSIICDVAASPQGTKTTKWDKNNTVTQAEVHPCHPYPYPTMVELDWPDDGATLLPSVVLLHRCVGECLGSQKIQNCTVMEQEEVMLRVIETKNSKSSFKNITVYNHTKCGCACRTRKSDCDIKNHDYSSNTCECKCKQALSKSCNFSIQSFNDKTCQCECNSAQKHCDSNNNEEWNKDICDCDCKQRVKDRCTRKNKKLNKKCECECPKPLPACPTGTSFLKYNCTCVDTSVSTK